MSSNGPWEQMAGNPLDRMIALTAHANEGFAGKRLFITLRDCHIEEFEGKTRLQVKAPKGVYYWVEETPEQIFELAGMPCPKTIKEKRAEKSANHAASPGS